MTDQPKSNPRGRRPKYPPDEVRRRLVDASIDALLTSGVSFGVDAVRIDRILVIADVPRGSAYSVFDHPDRTPQENLRHATVVEILRGATANSAAPTHDFAIECIDRLSEEISSGDIDRKRAARAEVTRQVAAFNHARLNSQMWRLYRALVTAVTTTAGSDPEIDAALEAGERRLLDTYVELLTGFAEMFAMRLKPDRTMEHLVMCVIALNDGLSNHTTDAFGVEAQHVTAQSGEEWSLYAIACEALFDSFFVMTA